MRRGHPADTGPNRIVFISGNVRRDKVRPDFDIVVDEYKQVATGKKDINTALRDADDRINKMVADIRAK